nr:putative secreted lipase [Quercus suber]
MATKAETPGRNPSIANVGSALDPKASMSPADDQATTDPPPHQALQAKVYWRILPSLERHSTSLPQKSSRCRFFDDLAKMRSFILSPLMASLAFALSTASRAAAPSVSIQNGTIIGATNSGIDSFKGIPFAQPPVGNLRLKPPQSINKSFGTLMATGEPRACPQQTIQVDQTGLVNLPSDVLGMLLDSPLLQNATNAGEDCLTMQVYRPAGTAPDAKLPVVFWIFGGGFELGWSGMYDGSNFVTKSVELGKPVIFVAVSYRVAGFGFLAGKELAADHSTNLGLRDQRLGLQWTAENIAGAISAHDHTIINGGDHTYKGKPLFRAAILNSGTTVPANPVTDAAPQAIYDTVVKNAGCSSASDTLACLRSVDYTTFLDASNSVPGILSYRSLDLSYLPRPDPGDNFFPLSPELPLRAGAYAKVPIIVGDQEDEGTLFSLLLGSLLTNADVIDYLTTYFPSNPNARSDVTALVATYPNHAVLGQPEGSPFRTGSLNNLYPQFKRIAAILGDITFTITRRGYLASVSSTVKTWSYLNTYFYGTPVIGTTHGLDLLYMFGMLGLQDSPVTQAVQTYYISFITDLDPNSSGGQTAWPQYDSSAGQTDLLEFQLLKQKLTPDTFRQATYDFLMSRSSNFRV